MKTSAAIEATARLRSLALTVSRKLGTAAGITRRGAPATLRFTKLTTMLALGLALLVAQKGGSAVANPDALSFSTGFLLTGDYAVGGVDLDADHAVNGSLTDVIHMGSVPPNADILAAFLYWETISPSTVLPPQAAATVKFRGVPITSTRVKSVAKPLTGNAAACWASQTPLTLTMFRADVLRLLPPQLDSTGTPTGKLLVNDLDLVFSGLPLNTVTLPESAHGLTPPQSAGASLVVVYRDASQPLRKIVLYDGAYIQPPGVTMTQNLRGFYQSSPSKSAKITHIVGNSTTNISERLFFNDSLIAFNPFPGSGDFFDRGWANPTFNVSPLMNPISNAGLTGFGETATTKVDHTFTNPYECLTWAAVIFSTAVKDNDGDGIPDGLEEAVTPLSDPNGAQLPNIHAIEGNLPAGKSSTHKDILIEVNAMKTDGVTRYGSSTAPYDSAASPPVVFVDAPAHNHAPTPEVLRMVGEAFKNAPILNSDLTTGIRAHFDVGSIANYHTLGAGYTSVEADQYLVPTANAKGGELITETACTTATPTCQFPAYPGTVGWGLSLEKLMLGLDISPLGPARFDKNENGLFHYVLFGHSRGKPKSLPCVDAHGTPINYEDGTGLCSVNPVTHARRDNPAYRSIDYHVPTSSSGVADLPGAKALVTLGRWDNFVGTPFIRASTMLHELGHNLGLWHGGAAPTWNPFTRVRSIQPNCKPDYVSIMSYMFQLRGLLDNAGDAHVDLSRATNGPLNETSLRDGVLSGLLYRTAWFEPAAPGSTAATQGLPIATKFCNGSNFPSPAPPNMARIDAPSVAGSINWDGLGPTTVAQDINFDGGAPQILTGFNDWANIDLEQTGSGRVLGDVSLGGQDFGGQDFGGQDFGGQDFGGQDFGGQDFGGQDFGGQDFGGQDFDGQDFGGQDFGGQDFGGDGEADLVIAAAMGNTPPNNLTACVIGTSPTCTGTPAQNHRNRLDWKVPNVGGDQVIYYEGYRYTGTITYNQVTASTPAPTFVGRTPNGTTLTLVDAEELPNGQAFTYFVIGVFSDTPRKASGRTNPFATVTAINNAPVAVADAQSTNEDTALLASVLPNDLDPDSVARLPLIINGPAHGSLAFNTTGPLTGTYTYTPAANYYGTDTFSYQLNAGTWPGPPTQPMSPNSTIVTVTVTVNPVNDVPSFAKGGDQTVLEDSGPQSISNWATALSAGPINETNGACTPLGSVVCNQVLTFIVSNNNNALFSVQPAVIAGGTLTYTPAPNAYGSALVSVTIHDNGGTAFGGVDTSAPLTFTISTTPVNDVPTFTKGANDTAAEDSGARSVANWATAISAGPANETNGACVPLSAVVCQQTLAFNVTNSNNALFSTQPAVNPLTGALTYTPAADANGSALVTVTLQDSGGGANGGVDTTAAQTFTITITEVNDPPVGVNDSLSSVAQGSGVRTISFASLLANDSAGPANESGQTLTITAVDSAVGGGVSLSGTDVLFTPAANFNGAASFVYTLQDNGTTNGVPAPLTATAIASFTITGTSNQPPIAVDDQYQMTQGTTLSVPATGALSYSNFSSTAGLALNGTAVQVPDNGLDGPVVRMASATDSQAGSMFTSVLRDITHFSTMFTFRLTNPGNGGADGLTFTLQGTGNAALGGGGGGLGYQGIAPSVAVESDTFDNGLPIDPDSNHLGINENGDVSSVQTQSVSLDFDDGGLWTAWIDYDGTTLELRIATDGVRPSAPTLARGDAGTPYDIPGILGAASAYVGFTASTGAAFENVDITSWNYSGAPVGILSNDSDADNDPLTASVVPSSGPSHGLLSFNADGSFTYVPNTSYWGPDSFRYTASDGLNPSNEATVTITVLQLGNEAPVAIDDSGPGYSTNEDTPLEFQAANLLANDSAGPPSESGQTLTVIQVMATGATHGSVTLSSGLITYTPDTNFFGVARFTYEVCDDGMTNGLPDPKCGFGTVTIDVAQANALAVAANTILIFGPSLDPSSTANEKAIAGQAIVFGEDGTATGGNGSADWDYVRIWK